MSPRASSSIGRAAVSKTAGWGFESLLACHFHSISLDLLMTETTDKLKLLGAVAILVTGLAAFYMLETPSQLLRVGVLIGCLIIAAAVALMSTQGQNAWEFAKGARGEIRRVVWPTRRDTITSTIIVIILVILIGLFLWMLDTISFWVIYDLLLNIGE